MFRKDTETNDIAGKMREQGLRTTQTATGLEFQGDAFIGPVHILPVWALLTAAFFFGRQAGLVKALPYSLPFVKGDYAKLLLSAEIPAHTGIPLADGLIKAGAQAAVVGIAAALLPLCVLLWRRARDQSRGSIYLSVWGMTVGLPFIIVFLYDFLWPILLDICSGF